MRHLITILTFLTVSIQVSGQSESLGIPVDSIAPWQTGNYELIDPFETMPEFPGGQDSLRTFIEQNNNWRAGQETIVGKVYIAFVVEKDGSITNIEILRGLSQTCDKEAKRIIGMMPNWKPGEQMGVPVRVKMIVPIIFDGMR
jgi:periplasmic protein TonB